MPNNTIFIKPKKSKYMEVQEEDLSRIVVVLKPNYRLGHLIIETEDGEYDVKPDGTIIKRIQ